MVCNESVKPSSLLVARPRLGFRGLHALEGAVAAAKEAILRGADMPLEHGLAYEDIALGRLMGTEDAQEGPRAFAEKRKPQYKGR